VAADNNNSPVFDGELRIAEHFPRPLFEDWEDLARRSLGSRTLESLTRTTHEGLDITPLYAAEDLPPSRITIHTPPRETWQTCFPVDLREPETAISQAIEGLSHGGNSLWAKVDRRKSTWGRLTVGAMTQLLEVAGGAPVYLDGRGATPALAALVAAAKGRLGNAAGGLRGAFDHDPLGTLAADGALPWSLETSFALMAGMVRWTEEHSPEIRAIAVSTLPYAKDGATAVDELSLAIATGVEYLRRLEAAGIAPEVVCRRLRFILPVGRDFFMEIAKLRAVRWLWARVAEACGVAPDARAVPVHAITSPRCLTVRDPWVNMLRGTVESFAAVVGGADVLTVLPFDSAAGQSDEFGRRIAVNTQTILREESGLDRVEDPAAGSYFVERLTHDLAAAAWDRFRHIEASEGMASYLLSGAVAREALSLVSSAKRPSENGTRSPPAATWSPVSAPTRTSMRIRSFENESAATIGAYRTTWKRPFTVRRAPTPSPSRPPSRPQRRAFRPASWSRCSPATGNPSSLPPPPPAARPVPSRNCATRRTATSAGSAHDPGSSWPSWAHNRSIGRPPPTSPTSWQPAASRQFTDLPSMALRTRSRPLPPAAAVRS